MNSPIARGAWSDPGFYAIVFAIISVVCTTIGYGGELVVWMLR